MTLVHWESEARPIVGWMLRIWPRGGEWQATVICPTSVAMTSCNSEAEARAWCEARVREGRDG